MKKIFTRFLSITLCFFIISSDLTYFGETPKAQAEKAPENLHNLELLNNSEEIPSLLYRVDSRNPTEIFESGFQIPGSGVNENLLDHVNGFSLIDGTADLAKTTNFVSTSTDISMAAKWIRTKDIDVWVYAIEPDISFYSINSSLENAAKNNADPLLRRWSNRVLDAFGNQSEWVARGGIKTENIVGAIPYRASIDGSRIPDIAGIINNDLNYVESTTSPSSDPFPITEVSHGCAAISKSVCNWEPSVPSSEQELLEVHLNNFGEDLGVGLEETGFVFSEHFVDGVRGRLHAPLQKSNELFTNFDATSGVEGFEELVAGLNSTITHDLEHLNAVSTNTEFAEKVFETVSTKTGNSLGRFAKELIPYAGIALTGYAISEDVRTGNWVDLGFDSVAEALMSLDIIAPEAIPFTEVALIVVITTQLIVDYFRGKNVDKPEIPQWEIDQAQRDLNKWLQSVDVLSDLGISESKQLVLEHTNQIRQTQLLDALKTRLDTDFMFLNQLRNSYAREINRQATHTASRQNVAESRDQIEQHRVVALEQLNNNFANLRSQRISDYANILQQQTQQVLSEITQNWSLGNKLFDHFVTEFDNHVAISYIEQIESLLWQHYQVDPNLIPLEGYNKHTRETVREQQLTDFQQTFALRSAYELAEIETPNKITENELLLRPPFVAPILDTNHLTPRSDATNNVINIGEGLNLVLQTSNLISANTENTKQVNEMFANIGRTTINVYDSDTNFLFTRDSDGLNLSDPQVRTNFYNNLVTVGDGSFVEFVFENPTPNMQLGLGGVTKLENVSHYVAQRVNNEFMAWIPADLDLGGLNPVTETRDTTILVTEGVVLHLDATQNSVVTHVHNPDTGLPLGNEQVNEAFAAAGKTTVTVYDTDHSFVESFSNKNFDLSDIEQRKQFFSQIKHVTNNQFVVFDFENPITFVSVGNTQEARLDNTTRFVAQRKNNYFVAWIPQDLAFDQPVLRQAINQSLGRENDAWVGRNDLLQLTNLEVIGDVSSVQILEHAVNLQKLTITHTFVQHLPNNFGDLSKLTILDLSNNMLKSLPNSFANLTNLEFLNLHRNQLVNISQIPTNLTNDQFTVNDQTLHSPVLLRNVFDNNTDIFTVSLAEHEKPVNRFGEFLEQNNFLLPNANSAFNCDQFGVDFFANCFVGSSIDADVFSYLFVDVSNNFSGRFVHQLLPANVGEIPGIEVNVGVAYQHQQVSNVLAVFSANAVIENRLNVPPGLGAHLVEGKLMLEGSPTQIGDNNFEITVIDNNRRTQNRFRLETAPQNRIILGKVGDKVSQFFQTLNNSTGSSRGSWASFGNLRTTDMPSLPSGVVFRSSWNDDHWCDWWWQYCTGSSDTFFEGHLQQAATVAFRVEHMQVTYGAFGQRFYRLTENLDATIQTCERDVLICGTT